MATAVIMPRQGQSVESCIITQWCKQVGEAVSEGEVLFHYETDKASFEEASPVSGILLKQLYEEGDEVPCLLNVCFIGEAGEEIADGEQAQETEELSTQAEDAQAVDAKGNGSVSEEALILSQDISQSSQEAAQVASAAKNVSPRAKALASKLNINHQLAEATGPKNRVIERDILRMKELGQFGTSAALNSGQELPVSGSGLGGRVTVSDLNKPVEVLKQENIKVEAPQKAAVASTSSGYRDEKLPNIRKVIAKAMKHSLESTSQLTLHTSFDASELMALRAKIKASATANITLTDMILYAVARVLKDFPALNAHLLGDSMRYFEDVNLGLAVDTERGLLVPTIMKADKLSLSELSEQVKGLAALCKGGTISPDLLTGASFTVTNLGAFGIECFTPVINAPQTGILGVNTIKTAVRDENGTLKTYPSMGLSLTFDHGALDGAPAARFLQALTKALENFSILLMQ